MTEISLITRKDNDRVMVFIDLRNMTNGCKRESGGEYIIDFEEMVNQIVDGRDLRGAYIFDSKDCFEDKCSTRFHTHLEYLGFRLSLRDNFDEELKGQKEVDVDMACEILLQAVKDSYDVAIVFSGDRDFRPVIERVQDMGKIVEVASFDVCSSPALKRSADIYHNLSSMCILKSKEMKTVPMDRAEIASNNVTEVDVEVI